MKGIRLILLTGLLAWMTAQVAWAKSDIFVAPFGGYSFGTSELDATDTGTSTQGSISIKDSSHYGIIVGMKTRDPGDVYLLYSHQSTDMHAAGMFNPNRLAKLELDYAHLGGSLYFPKGDLRPYVTVSVGMTQMRPSGDFSDESRFSMGIGGGVEYQLGDNFSLFADGRGYATFINSDNELFCDANRCIWNIRADVIWQGQVNAGFKYTF